MNRAIDASARVMTSIEAMVALGRVTDAEVNALNGFSIVQSAEPQV